MRNLKLGVMAVAMLLGVVLSVAPQALAESFNQNNIIDDRTFNKVGAMSAGQIDAFLNTFANSCISPNSGFRSIDPTGYNPSSGYQYGGFVTAGQVIYDSAQAYELNPQVLIATLEKEQSLIVGRNNFSGYCNNGDQHKYAAAVGYGCPDSGTTYNYSGLSLYQRNGVTVTSTGTTCVNSASKAGFSQQVIRAAWLLKFGQQRSEGNINWAVIKGNWNNSDDPQTCYGGPMTQGNYARCPSGASAFYDGYSTIDGTAVHMDNGATAALYWYTPHFHGNQNFFSLFYGWFGPTHSYFGTSPSHTSLYARSACTVPNYDPALVGRLYQPDVQDFIYTTNWREACLAVSYGYIWDGIVMRTAQGAGAIPVYRVANTVWHLYTTDVAARDAALGSGYHDEGIGFYAYGSAAADRIPVYGLQSGPTVFMTSAGKEAEAYTSTYGYTSLGIKFYTPALDTGDFTVTRLMRNNQRIYTPDQTEINSAISYGFHQEGSVATDDIMPNAGNMPVYRLRTPAGIYFYTTSRYERDVAVIYYDCSAEGTPFYGLAWSNTPIYRANNPTNGFWISTGNAQEYADATQRYGYNGAGVGWYGY